MALIKKIKAFQSGIKEWPDLQIRPLYFKLNKMLTSLDFDLIPHFC